MRVRTLGFHREGESCTVNGLMWFQPCKLSNDKLDFTATGLHSRTMCVLENEMVGGWYFNFFFCQFSPRTPPPLWPPSQAVQLGLAGCAWMRKLLLASTLLYLGFSTRRRISASSRCRKPGSMAVPPITTTFSDRTFRASMGHCGETQSAERTSSLLENQPRQKDVCDSKVDLWLSGMYNGTVIICKQCWRIK